jgi:transcription termination/antitermination protein NusA
MSTETLSLIEQIAREKGLDVSVLIDALKSAVEAAARKRMPHCKELHSEFNEATGEVEIFAEKTVVESVTQPDEEISLAEAQAIAPEVELGEQVLVQQVLENYGRIAAQLAKQVILQKVREAEIDQVYKEFIHKKGELINGIMQRYEHGDVIVDLGKAEGVLPRREQVFRETFNRGERIRAYILDIRKTSKNAMVILSRTHTGLIKRLFEMEVPEISEGMVEIMDIVREPNGRTKIAVRTNDRDIDAVGACVGMRGMRVQAIVQELRGEKIDIVEYSDDPEVFIRNALSPAKISRIVLNEAARSMAIIVADDQMSLAIGKKGQNVRLAAKLVKWKIDIQGQAEAATASDSGGLFAPKVVSPQKDFLDLVKDTKGLGEKIMSALFSGDVVSYKEAMNRGVKGLTQLPGIGPKKADAILALIQEEYAEQLQPAGEEDSTMAPEDAEDLENIAPEPLEELVEETAEEEEIVEEADEDDEDILVDELVDIDSRVIEILKQNEFQTLEELSITPLEELVAIDGIDENVALSILSQAQQRINNS